jgi:uncharacterized YigZ family protein
VNTVARVSEGLYKDKGSKFFAYLAPFNQLPDFQTYLQQLKKQHHNATHICFAYIIGEHMRENDDGEPAKTAGKPIMRQIQSALLQDVAILVVRYYGGINLGTGGLIQAYGAAAHQAITNNDLIPIVETVTARVEVEYNQNARLKNLLAKHQVNILHASFEANCVFTIQVNKEKWATVEPLLLPFVLSIYTQK